MLKILINNRSFFVVFLLWLIVGALLQIFYTPTVLMFWVNAHHSEQLDMVFKYLTILGEDIVWLGLLIGLILSNYISKARKFDKIKALFVAWLAKVFVSVSLKNIFNLPRPMEVYQNTGREIHLVKGVDIHYFQSFPSGHTMTAFAFACFVVLFLKQPKWGIFSLFVAILVGYSRMYLFQHFPRDIFAGGILGVSVVVIVSLIPVPKGELNNKSIKSNNSIF